ncbi:MAG: MBL fold metallo-hydrolase [Rhodospirillaceae bacterium]|nr:MBL fold metallo-hydrolase [Rhodospirillaceae bacterium]
MTVVDTETGTRIDEIAPDIFRINTPLRQRPGGFSYNQYLIRDEAPLLFHTGPRALFAATAKAVDAVLPLATLRYVGLSHYEADECGALNQFLAAAPRAEPLCSKIAAMVAIGDQADRPPKPMEHGEALPLGRHTVEWVDAPHLPHGWECGYLYERSESMLFCGDLFTQPGTGDLPLTTADILAPSEAFRHRFDYFSHTRNLDMLIERLAALQPKTLACMHGSAWQGDGAGLLRALGRALASA